MDISKVKESIEVFLKLNGESIFNKEQITLLNNCFYMIMYHIQCLENDEDIVGNNDYKIVHDAIILISDKVLSAGLSPSFIDFVNAYCYLIYNWNQNILKNKDIELLCIFNRNTLNLCNSILSTSAVLRDIHEHYVDLASWMPPAFDISKAYLGKLLNSEKEEIIEVED